MSGRRATERAGSRASVGAAAGALVTSVALLVGLTACDAATDPAPTFDGPATATTGAPQSEAPEPGPAGDSTVFTADDLGVELTLTSDFVEVPSDLPLTVERPEPRTILSIDGFGSSVPLGDYDPQPGEDVTTTTIDGVDVLVILHSEVGGLPAGVEANTLIADNGARSFSLIMSAAPEDLEEAWEQLMAGIGLTPA